MELSQALQSYRKSTGKYGRQKGKVTTEVNDYLFVRIVSLQYGPSSFLSSISKQHDYFIAVGSTNIHLITKEIKDLEIVVLSIITCNLYTILLFGQ